MGNNFSSKYELFRNVKADDKKGLNRNYGIFLVLRRKTGRLNNSGLPFLLIIFKKSYSYRLPVPARTPLHTVP